MKLLHCYCWGRWCEVSLRTPGMGVPGVKLWWVSAVLPFFSFRWWEQKLISSYPQRPWDTEKNKWFSRLPRYQVPTLRLKSHWLAWITEICGLSSLIRKVRNHKISFKGLLQRWNDALCVNCWSQEGSSQLPVWTENSWEISNPLVPLMEGDDVIIIMPWK